MTAPNESPPGYDLPGLGPVSRRGLALIRQHGMVWYVLLPSIAASVIALAVGVSIAIVANFEQPYVNWTVVLSGVIPFLIAPWMLYVNGQAVVHLDEVSRLLHESSLTDPLTGIRNRRGFFSEIESLEGLGGRELCVTLVDIDDFKDVNDTHGHAIGDDGLVLVSAWLQLLVGNTGIVARMGGDEFATVCDTDRADSIPESMEFIHRSVRFTASIGTAPYTPGEQRIETALANADTAMYTRKSDSRSRRSTR